MGSCQAPGDGRQHLEAAILDPGMVTGQNWMCRSYSGKGMYAESLTISEKTLQTNFPFYHDISYAYAKSGRRQEAEAIINKWKELEKRNI
jgi:hypothetical protein